VYQVGVNKEIVCYTFILFIYSDLISVTWSFRKLIISKFQIRQTNSMLVELLLIFSEIVGKGTSVRSRAQIQTCYECETISAEEN